MSGPSSPVLPADLSHQSLADMQPKPSTFLSLVPETSASYPTAQKSATTAATPGGDAAAAKSRSSSVSSQGSARFLKLGPVHWGEHQGDHKHDFHHVARDGENAAPK
ncbi:hypothetical protein GGR56DRAFT_548922 [Xylariaceae sp. FL0804]|nr:hypothetical protein GGR56DRAFT_548922 [Xylariaceae sp. FL0804]